MWGMRQCLVGVEPGWVLGGCCCVSLMFLYYVGGVGVSSYVVLWAVDVA
jgi:hypothetical protein